MIYTKSGDNGLSSIIGKNDIPKDDDVFKILGGIDEISSKLGVARYMLDGQLKLMVKYIQQELMSVGTFIAGGEKYDFKIVTSNIEEMIDDLEKYITRPKNFIISGDSLAGAHLDVARAAVRRTERDMVAFCRDYVRFSDAIAYFNRLSDLLYIMARHADALSEY